MNDSKPKRLTVSKLVRRTHLFVALFMTPWITMYGASTLVMHHRKLFTGHERRVPPDYRLLGEQAYDLQIMADDTRDEIAERILADLDISGAYSARGDAATGTLTIDRHRAIGSYRVTYDSQQESLQLEQQKFGLAFFLEMLHRRRGFSENYWANDLWGLTVDLVIVAIVLWAFTGLWMWFGISRTRKLGSLCLFGGSGLFALLLWTL